MTNSINAVMKGHKRKLRWKLSIGSIIKHVFILFIAAIVLLPFLWLIVSSFKTDIELFRNPGAFFPEKFTLEAYTGIWDRIPFLDLYFNTIIFAGGVMVFSLLLDSMAGYAFARLRFKGRNLLFVLVLAMMMIPFQVIMIPLYIEVHFMGLIDSYWGLILPRASHAFGIFMMRQFFLTLPKDLEEAARIDGCNEFKIFWKVMLPLCKPALLSLGIFVLMGNWNDLLYPLLLTTSDTIRPIQAGIALLVGKYSHEYTYVLSSSILALLPILIAFIFAQKYFIKGIAMTGLK